MAEFSCELRCRLENLRALDEALLWTELHVVLDDCLYCAHYQFRADSHQFVVNLSNGLIRSDLAVIAVHNSAGVHTLVDHKRCHTCSLLAVDHSPVDRGGTTVLREKCSVEVECTELRDLPDYLRKHSECNDHEEVCLPAFQCVEELRILEGDRLKYRKVVLHCIFLHGAFVDLQAASACLVGYRNHSNHIVAVLDERVKWRYSKLRRTHIDYSGLLECTHYHCL